MCIDETLVAHQVLLNSEPPAKTTIKAMRDWFRGVNSSKTEPVPQLFDSSKRRFDDASDLVALRVPADQDRLSEFILHHFGAFFKVRVHLPSSVSINHKTNKDSNSFVIMKAETSDGYSAYISEHSLARSVTILSSLLSAILLFGSITSLYFVHNPYSLLGMLGAWTVLFAVSVGWLTNAKRDQVFAATAAYAAVLVVFVSGTLGGAQQVPVSIVNGTWICEQK